MTRLRMHERRLIRSAGSKWGPGKVHFEYKLDGFGPVPLCNNKSLITIYGERFVGTNNDVTCKRCLAVTPENFA